MSKGKSLSKLFLELAQNPIKLDDFLQNPSNYTADLKKSDRKKLKELTHKYTLSTLFYSLGEDKEKRHEFMEDPKKFNKELSQSAQKRLEALITPNELSLPDGESITAGNFYFGPDDGTAVYQLYSTQLAPYSPPDAKISQTTNYSVPLDESTSGELSLTNQSNVKAIKHFKKKGRVRAKTFHKVEISTLNVKVNHWPEGESVLLATENPITFNSPYEATINIKPTDKFDNLEVGGLGVMNQTLSPSSDIEIKVKLNQKDGYIVLDAPGNFLTIPFGSFKNKGPYLPNGGPVVSGAFYLTTTDADGNLEIYLLYSTRAKPHSSEPPFDIPNQIASDSTIIIPDRVSMKRIETGKGETNFGLSGINKQIAAVKVFKQTLDNDVVTSNLPNTYHGVVLTNFQLIITNAPIEGSIAKCKVLKVCLEGMEPQYIEIAIKFTNNQLPKYLYISGPYIHSQKITDFSKIPTNGKKYYIQVTFSQYQGFVSLLTTGSYHEIDLPTPSEFPCT